MVGDDKIERLLLLAKQARREVREIAAQERRLISPELKAKTATVEPQPSRFLAQASDFEKV